MEARTDAAIRDREALLQSLDDFELPSMKEEWEDSGETYFRMFVRKITAWGNYLLMILALFLVILGIYRTANNLSSFFSSFNWIFSSAILFGLGLLVISFIVLCGT